MKQYIYADNAATTKLDIAAFEAMKPYLLDEYGNASQLYSFAREPKKALRQAREMIAACIGAESDEIYFTSGGTESDNWAIHGVVSAASERKAIVTSAIEHHAILNACKAAEMQGTKVAYLPVDRFGRVLPDSLSNIITNNTLLVSIMLTNNEIGTIEPIKELCDIAHRHGVIFHTDAVQALGHIKVDVKELGVDLLSASAHKFNGPKGIGFLYAKRGTPIFSWHNGGAQERGLRAGTEDVASIVGMAVALKKNCDAIDENSNLLFRLEKQLLEGLEGLDYIRNGASDDHVPGNISLSFKNADGEAILHRMDLKGICISTGSACDSINTQISHVITAIQVPTEYAPGTIRISLGKYNTSADVDAIIEDLRGIVG